jgi:integrase
MPRGKSGSSQPFQRPGTKNWYIRYTVPGEPVERTESTRTSDERKARKILAAKQTEANQGKTGPRGVTVGNLLDLYLDDKRKAGKPLASAEGYIRLHLRPAFGNLIAEKITTDHIDRFIAMKKAAGKANASINRWLEALNRAYTIGRDERDPQLVRKTPKINMLDETGNVREGFLTHEQYEALLAELPPHLQTLLVLGFHLGMRRGELVKLKWSQVEWHANSIRLEKAQTKSKQARLAPLYGTLRKWLEAAYVARDADCPTIVAYQSAPLTKPGESSSIAETKTAWASARIRAGVPDILIHDLRRTAVRNMVRAGIPEKTAMLISGHKTRSMFDRYTIIDEKDIELAGQKLEAFERAEKEVRAKVRAVGQKATEDAEAGNAYNV